MSGLRFAAPGNAGAVGGRTGRETDLIAAARAIGDHALQCLKTFVAGPI